MRRAKDHLQEVLLRDYGCGHKSKLIDVKSLVQSLDNKKAAKRQLGEPSCVPGLRTDTSGKAGICHVYIVELLTKGWPQPTHPL